MATLSPVQIAEFKTQGAVRLPALIPPHVLKSWREQIWGRCASDGVDLDDPASWPAGRYAPEGGWPELEPNVYDLPEIQNLVDQLGGAGQFVPSFPAGAPPSPQVPMTRVILPSEPGTDWSPPLDGHLDGYATGWGGGFMAFFTVLLSDVDSPTGGGTAYWPRSHLANHRHFLNNPELFDGTLGIFSILSPHPLCLCVLAI